MSYDIYIDVRREKTKTNDAQFLQLSVIELIIINRILPAVRARS